MPLSVDEKEVAFVPNSVPGLAVKTLPGPHVDMEPAVFVLCDNRHSLLSSTL